MVLTIESNWSYVGGLGSIRFDSTCVSKYVRDVKSLYLLHRGFKISACVYTVCKLVRAYIYVRALINYICFSSVFKLARLMCIKNCLLSNTT